jgi:hypothetical protein
MLVLIRWQSPTMAVPLSQLTEVNVDESIAEAIADWHYWVGPRLLLLSRYPAPPIYAALPKTHL